MSKYLLSISLLFWFTSPILAQGYNCTRGNCQEGYGTCIYVDGTRYEGDFVFGKREGKGIMTYTDGTKYIGHWTQDKRQGRGRLVMINGDVYLGDFQHNRFHGEGTLTYANGSVYEGNFVMGVPSGRGTLTEANGMRYVGDFENNQRHGQGVMYYNDGSRYEGEWQDDERQGLGTYYYPNGQEVSGQWERGEYLSDWNSLAFTGDKASLRNCNLKVCNSGKGKFTYQDGSMYYGDFNKGIPEGIGTIEYTSGNRYEGGWLQHAPHGRGVMYYTSGKIVGAVWDAGNPIQKLFEKQQAPQSSIAVDQSPEIKIWAVIVGAARYTHMPALRYTDDDAYQVFAFLKSPEGGALPDNQIRLLIDEDATHQGITEAMRQVFLRADDNDMVLFYFSGHGLKGAFLPIDYDGYDNRLEHEDIRQILHSSRAKHKLVLADACHAGSLLAAKAPLHLALRSYYDALDASKGGTALLLSSKGEEYSLEDRGLRSGIFSHFLIRGLKGEANTDNNNIVTIRELFSYVYQQVRQYTGNVQTPTLTGDFDDRMPVSVLRQ